MHINRYGRSAEELNSDPENEVMQPFLEPAEEMRGETHYEGDTYKGSWTLGRDNPRRRRGWVPGREAHASHCSRPPWSFLIIGTKRSP